MTDLRTAAQQALEALEKYRHMMFAEAGCRFGEGDAAITALKDALATGDNLSPTEPVAVALHTGTKQGIKWNREVEHGTKLYAAPPQRKPLTEEEIDKAYREIYRNLPSDFDHTTSGWIEQGIRYAERAHGITA